MTTLRSFTSIKAHPSNPSLLTPHLWCGDVEVCNLANFGVPFLKSSRSKEEAKKQSSKERRTHTQGNIKGVRSELEGHPLG